MKDLIKIITTVEEHGILLKGISKKIKNEAKEQKGGFLSMLLGTLGASLLGNLLTGKGMYRAGQGMYRTGQGLKKKSLTPFHPWINFEIMDYFKEVKGFKVGSHLPKKIVLFASLKAL